ncbi:MAG: ABC transporter permease, partial [Alistipes sp.]|nr:ABC transporter permease [Alistipes sp.]
QLKRRNRFSILPVLFGVEGELAGNALRAQKKALRTTSLSLTLAFLGFMLIQCFFTLSGISTNHTYFEAYQDMWDVMVTVKDTGIEEFALTGDIRDLPEVDDCAAYQKAEAVCVLPKEAQSRELAELGGFLIFAGENASLGEDFLLVDAPVIILDDVSFGEFCEENGITPRFDGTIILNRFWDSVHSNFRSREYISFVRDDIEKITLRGALGSDVEIPVLACTENPPLLREEYADYSLVQFVPQSLWKELSGRIAGEEKDMYVRVLAAKREDLEMLAILEKDIMELTVGRYEAESENRIQERLDNDEMIAGYETIMGAFCVLFAVIGTAHVFSHTLGFLRQRKREFARYMSVGLAPEGIRKVFCIEALVLVGRPMFASLLVTIAAVAVMVNASHLAMAEFLAEAPVLPAALFLLAVFAFVALAYYLGARRILNVPLADALRDETVL